MNNLIDRIVLGIDCYDPEEINELAIASAGYIMQDIQDIKKTYVSLGFHLNEMETYRYYEDLGYTDFYECVQKNFHMDKSAVSRCIGVWREFAAFDDKTDSRKMWLDERYANYSYSQLVEMVPLKPEQRRRVSSDMTVTQIREFKRQLRKPNNVETEIHAEPKAVAMSQQETVASDEKLSAYGTRLKVKDEKSLVCTPGCENDTCFSCHLNCEIRQEECYCVEAPLGNSFPCTTLAVYENIKQDIGDACQFINIELAEIRKGDGAAVPCCKKCKAPCGYQCNRASKWRYEKKELERQKQEELEKKEQLIDQPEFPDMKNMQEREDFVNTYKMWNIWCRNDLTEEVFYRYDLPDGAAIVVKNYPYYVEWKKEDYEGKDLYLLKPGYKHFADCKTNMTQIKDYLKDLVKKGD